MHVPVCARGFQMQAFLKDVLLETTLEDTYASMRTFNTKH